MFPDPLLSALMASETNLTHVFLCLSVLFYEGLLLLVGRVGAIMVFAYLDAIAWSSKFRMHPAIFQSLILVNRLFMNRGPNNLYYVVGGCRYPLPYFILSLEKEF